MALTREVRLSSLLRIRWVPAAFSAIVLMACSDDGAGSALPPPPPPPVLALLVKAEPSGDNQIGTLGAPLASMIRVKAIVDGAPAAGVTVSWSSTNGQVSGTTLTGADGIASATWTLGSTPGGQSARATSQNTVVFNATATASGGSVTAP